MNTFAPVIVHFASREQLEPLFRMFAEAVEQGNSIIWVAPNWLRTMYSVARPQGSPQHYPTLLTKSQGG